MYSILPALLSLPLPFFPGGFVVLARGDCFLTAEVVASPFFLELPTGHNPAGGSSRDGSRGVRNISRVGSRAFYVSGVGPSHPEPSRPSSHDARREKSFFFFPALVPSEVPKGSHRGQITDSYLMIYDVAREICMIYQGSSCYLSGGSRTTCMIWHMFLGLWSTTVARVTL